MQLLLAFLGVLLGAPRAPALTFEASEESELGTASHWEMGWVGTGGRRWQWAKHPETPCGVRCLERGLTLRVEGPWAGGEHTRV